MTGKEYLEQLKAKLADPQFHTHLACERKERQRYFLERGRQIDLEQSQRAETLECKIKELEEKLNNLQATKVIFRDKTYQPVYFPVRIKRKEKGLY